MDKREEEKGIMMMAEEAMKIMTVITQAIMEAISEVIWISGEEILVEWISSTVHALSTAGPRLHID